MDRVDQHPGERWTPETTQSLVRFAVGTVVALVVGVGACFVAFNLVKALGGIFFPSEPSAPPPYANASEIKQWSDLTDDRFPKGMISFRTNDEPASVQSFYSNYLKKEGWEFGNFPFDDPNIAYFQYWPNDGPVYKVLILARTSDPGPTQVVITMTSNYSSWHGKFWDVKTGGP
ncbi:MAG: hypothetical protein ACJ78Q_03765 [Chloroflexia bacterium]